MTALIIILIVLLILLFLLLSKVSVHIAVHDSEYDLKIMYLFFKIFPFKEKKKRTKTKKKSKRKSDKDDKKEEASDEKKSDNISSESDSSVAEKSDKELLNPNGDEGEKQGKLDKLLETVEKIKLIVSNSAPGVKRVYNNIRIDDIVIDFRIAGEDPFKAAMKYGGISAATYNIISLARCYFNLSIISVDINCLFDRKESTYDAELKVNMTLSVLIVAGLNILWNLYKNKDKITDKD